MASVVYTRNYSAPPINRKDIFRYAGVRAADAELESLLDSCLAEAEDKLSYRLCLREFSVNRENGILDLEFAKTSSRALGKCLDGCEKIVLFAATVGIELDRLIARYSSISPARALMLQAIGTERIESLCDAFCQELTREKGRLTPRFSAGYGDLPLELQRDIFIALDCQRKIGITLNESLLMSPSKSVSAIVGIVDKKLEERNK